MRPPASARQWAWAVSLLLLPTALPILPAQDYREAGAPYLRNYTYQEYGLDPQNWAALEDQRGVMYFGNIDGILEYDGSSWRTIRVRNGSIVRSLGMDRQGTIYVGCQGDFGYLAAGPAGTLQYFSLLDQVPPGDRAFKDVWQVLPASSGVYFRTDQRMFRWAPASGIKVWTASDRFHRAYLIRDTVYAIDRGVGLKRVTGDSLKIEPSGGIFANLTIRFASARGERDWLVGARDRMLLYDGATLSPFPTEADDLLRKRSLYQALLLPDGALAMAFEGGGVALLNREGRLLRLLDESAGLQDDRVNFLCRDRQGGLWLALNNGIARVEIPAPLTLFDERAGLKGAVQAVARSRGTLYVATYFGVFRLQPADGATPARFVPVQGYTGSCWTLLSTAGGLLVGSNDGVFLIQSEGAGARARLEWKSGTIYVLSPSARDPALVYAGGRDGVALLRLREGHWSQGERVAAVNEIVRGIAEESGGAVWLGTNHEGVLRLNPRSSPPSVDRFDSRAGLPQGWVKPFDVAGRLLFGSPAGLLRFRQSDERFLPDPEFGPMFADGSRGVYRLASDGRGNVWINTSDDNGVLRGVAGGNLRWDPLPLRRVGKTVTHAVYPEADGAVWVGLERGVARYDPSSPKDYTTSLLPMLRRVSYAAQGGIVFDGLARGFRKPVLPFARDALRFEFAAPVFDDDSRTEYQVLLDGFDRDWSPWAAESHKDYTNLPDGRYVFRLRARNLYGKIGSAEDFSFATLPPWYRAWWAYALYALAGAVALYGFVRWRLWLLEASNRRLQAIVRERTREIYIQAEDLRQKNRELARLDEEKTEFLSIAAHDLKNPLAEMRLSARFLKADPDALPPRAVVEFADGVESSAALMVGIVTNLLDINRIEQGKLAARMEPCDLVETARAAVKAYQQRAEAKQIALHFFEDGEDGTGEAAVLGDPSLLLQILDNLVSNAVKYSPPGRSVYVRAGANGETARAEVRDQGPGIRPEEQARLFEKFARLSAQPTAGESSTGLGLAIVKRLTEAMHGKVWCESQLGSGATFHLELPLLKERREN